MIQKFPRETLQNTWNSLQSKWQQDGYFASKLSSSALATAIAMFALYSISPDKYKSAIEKGQQWLELHSNLDGGWGDTPKCPSNITASLLVYSAQKGCQLAIHDTWLKGIVEMTPQSIILAIQKLYGKDQTFAVPILTMLTLSGVLGTRKDTWKYVPQLPFELSILPAGLWNLLRMPVVSYAIPALIAIGRVRHHFYPSYAWGYIRNQLIPSAMNILQSMQPSSGGFLEAIPLTGFVVMSLAHCEEIKHPVTQAGGRFLQETQLSDGSWPIDINLDTWVTTLSIQACISAQRAFLNVASLAIDNESEYEKNNENTVEQVLFEKQVDVVHDWLANQQWQVVHPFTYARPGGWGWTNKDGAVPDADDTSGALLAMFAILSYQKKLQQPSHNIIMAIQWLLKLQNRDGGIPTFCRGWGQLPFDTSCPDITAHALRAIATWWKYLPADISNIAYKAMIRMLEYFQKHQTKDGAWLPLWFGNPFVPMLQNSVYGTSQVNRSLYQLLVMYKDMKLEKGVLVRTFAMWQKSGEWLLKNQNKDGGWGKDQTGKSSIEETALALTAIANFMKPISSEQPWKSIPQAFVDNKEAPGLSEYAESLHKGTQYITAITQSGKKFPSTPIGLYFSSLWYSEEVYPIVFTLQALTSLF